MTDAARPAVDGSGDFVGREVELAALVGALDQARGGRGALYLIGGEPGIGKSRLADEFARHARHAGARVLWGRCWEGGGAPAYWPWIQALRGHLRNVERAEALDQFGAGAADIAQMLPEIRALAPDLPPPPPESDSARFKLFDSTASFLRNVARDRETVLLLDDLHAGDTPSVLLLRFVASQLSDMRLVVVGTYRDVELTAGHPLAAALTEVAREPITRMLTLGGLRADAVTRLIESTAGVAPPARLAREMWRETGGNPLFLGEAVRLLQSERRLDEVAASGSLRLSVPAGVREVIARRVRQLSPATVQALTVGAALGPEFSTETLRRVGDYAPGDVSGLLDEAVGAGLLAAVTGSPGRFRFSHDLVRESVYQEQSAAERARLHGRIAQVLDAAYGAAPDSHQAELAHHYFEAAHVEGGTAEANLAAKAQSYAARAGEVAARSLAYEEAARLYRMALSMLDLQASPDDDTRAELLLAIGDAEARAGEIDSANVSFVQAADVARRTGNARHLARAVLGIGGRMPWARPGHNMALIPLLQEALVLLGGTDEPLRVRLLSRLACAWRSSPDKRQQSETLSRQAIEVARRMGDAATLSYALAARYWATWWPENPDERLQLATEMITVAEALGDGERMVDARTMLWLTHTEFGHMSEAARAAQEIRRLGEELRQPAHRWLGVASAALVALMSGAFELAEGLVAQEAAPGPPTTSARDNVSAATFHRFLLLTAQGRPHEAEREVRAAVEEFPWYPLHRAALCLLLLDLGRDAEAAQTFDGLARDDFSGLYRDNEWLLGMSLVSEACARLENAAAAETLYEQLAPFAGRHAIGHAEGSVGAVDRYLGLLAATMDRLDDAVRHLEEAVRLNERMAARPWTTHSQHDLARVLRRRGAAGDLERAQDLERAALSTARELGMSGFIERYGGLVAAEPARIETTAAAADAAAFRREGDYWTILFGRDAFRLRDSKGLRYLERLLAEPGREFLTLDLAREETDAGPRSGAGESQMRTTDLGDAGLQLDDEAKAAYRGRLRELQLELDEAESWNDPERADRARGEMEFLTREMSRAVGLGGRDRAVGSAIERARVSVTRAIRLTMAKIAENSAALAAHLEATVHTGTYCAYRPDPRASVTWET